MADRKTNASYCDDHNPVSFCFHWFHVSFVMLSWYQLNFDLMTAIHFFLFLFCLDSSIKIKITNSVSGLGADGFLVLSVYK